MSKPDLFPKKSTAGIALDPRTLERVIPESRRPDGSVRKQIKIRPGFTPQEDVGRFRGKKQSQMDASALPKGHIIGWAPPASAAAKASAAAAASASADKSKAAKKNEKRREKRREKREVEGTVKDSWEDDDEDEQSTEPATAVTSADGRVHTSDRPNWAAAPADTKKDEAIESASTSTEALADAVANLEVR